MSSTMQQSLKQGFCFADSGFFLSFPISLVDFYQGFLFEGEVGTGMSVPVSYRFQTHFCDL